MDLRLNRKVAVVTGGAQGIGAAISRSLLAEGVRVAIADLSVPSEVDLQADFGADGEQLFAQSCNVAEPESVAQFFQAAAARFGGADILVNNAGIVRDKSILKMEYSDWDSVLQVNLTGPWLCSKAAIPHMRSKGWGRIINIASRAHWGNPGQSNYSSAKAGLVGQTRALALECGRKGINVNAVAPGFIVTDAIEALPNIDVIKQGALEKNSVPRLGDVDDVASLVAFLASDLAGYINGELIHVSGGRYAG